MLCCFKKNDVRPAVTIVMIIARTVTTTTTVLNDKTEAPNTSPELYTNPKSSSYDKRDHEPEDRSDRHKFEGTYEKKKVRFEKRYLVDETDTGSGDDSASESDASIESNAFNQSDNAYHTVMGHDDAATLTPQVSCNRCHREFPSAGILAEHELSKSCMQPEELGRENCTFLSQD